MHLPASLCRWCGECSFQCCSTGLANTARLTIPRAASICTRGASSLGPHIRLGVGLGHAVSLPALALLGLFVGYIAGMFGVGGGFILTPALIYFFGVPAPVAVGSALCQKCGTSIGSLRKYRKFGHGEPRIDLIMIGGSLIGVDVGTRLLSWLESLGRLNGNGTPYVRLVLDGLFFVLLAYIAVFTFGEAYRASKRPPRGDVTIAGPLAKVRIPPYIDLPSVGLTQVSVPVMAYFGLALGIASGLMGIGGGVLLMPVLLYGYGLSVRNAAGTGLLLLFVTVAFGTFEQALQGNVSLSLALAVLLGSSIGAQLGAMTTHRVSNRLLRIIFGVLVSATVCMVGWDFISAIG